MRTGYNTSLVTSVLKYVQMWVTWLCVYIRDIVCPLTNWCIGTPAECEVPKMQRLRAVAHICHLITAGQINSLSLDAWPHCSEMCNVYGFHDLCVQRLANAWGSVTTNSIKSHNFVGIQFHIRIVYRFLKDFEWSTRTESVKRLYV